GRCVPAGIVISRQPSPAAFVSAAAAGAGANALPAPDDFVVSAAPVVPAGTAFGDSAIFALAVSPRLHPPITSPMANTPVVSVRIVFLLVETTLEPPCKVVATVAELGLRADS